MPRNKKEQKVVSDDLINISMSSKEKENPTPPSANDYKIFKEDDGYYVITLEEETLIRTKPSDAFIGDLIMMQLLPPQDDPGFNEALESYLIRGAKEFVSKGLHKYKQDGRGKIDIAGIEDEF